MKWPWHRSDPAVESRDASRARSDAEEHLEEAESQERQVRQVASELRDLSHRNHFGAAIEDIFRGKR